MSGIEMKAVLAASAAFFASGAGAEHAIAVNGIYCLRPASAPHVGCPSTGMQ